MIPAIVHQFWTPPVGAAPDLPEDIAKNVAAWRRLHPEYGHRLWSFDGVAPRLEDIDGVCALDAVRRCRFPAMQSDIVRLALVYLDGGVWSDLKNLPLRPFLDEVCTDPLVLCEHPPTHQVPDRDEYLTNNFFAAEPRHPFVRACLEQAVQNVNSGLTDGGVVAITGLAMMMRVRHRLQKAGQMPRYRFLPKEDVWGRTMKRTSASYNAVGHWSQRQKTEPLYA